MSVETGLLVAIILELLVVFFMGLKLKDERKMTKMYYNMYLESVEILSDLVVKDQLVMDFDEDLSENEPKSA